MDTEAIPRTPVGFGSQRERRLDCTVDQGTDPGFGLLKSFSHLDPLTCTCAFAILNCYLTSMIYLCHALQTSNYNLLLPLMYQRFLQALQPLALLCWNLSNFLHQHWPSGKTRRKEQLVSSHLDPCNDQATTVILFVALLGLRTSCFSGKILEMRQSVRFCPSLHVMNSLSRTELLVQGRGRGRTKQAREVWW